MIRFGGWRWRLLPPEQGREASSSPSPLPLPLCCAARPSDDSRHGYVAQDPAAGVLFASWTRTAGSDWAPEIDPCSSTACFDRSTIRAGRFCWVLLVSSSFPLQPEMRALARTRALALLPSELTLHASLRLVWLFGVLWCELGAYRYAVWVCGWPDNRLKAVRPGLTCLIFHRGEAHSAGLPSLQRARPTSCSSPTHKSDTLLHAGTQASSQGFTTGSTMPVLERAGDTRTICSQTLSSF